MRRAVARGRSAARAMSLSVIGPLVWPNACKQAQAAVEALDEIGGALLASSRFSFGMPSLEPFRITSTVQKLRLQPNPDMA